ncbi:ubiquinol-cytochrome-c reductase complex assembly factor 3 [Salarias fasciatus]|uniref:Ubiquinol-cytochrome-c reductase complex assembly factor 3 n=1 Tax=Salarias fasciatus TaxID=181472 RepID=A0A672HNG3_SALFA|nr:ubiquinol-cytochrome-c reductase complex assembly factor 3 [Salarias fasciatus]XP_029959846.1 ubiquinol-cytochrome-c reductase complex assembly factor 3 [Salarias fasciatus]
MHCAVPDITEPTHERWTEPRGKPGPDAAGTLTFISGPGEDGSPGQPQRGLSLTEPADTERPPASAARMSGLRTILTSTAMVAVLGVGYGTWSIISPGEERRKEMLKNLPEANPVRMEETRKRNAMLMQVLKEAAETKDNIARSK